MFRRRIGLDRVGQAIGQLELPDAVFATCPWQPRDRIELGLRQWLRCAGVALRDGLDIGLPSRAVDEAWHGFILCTARYATFCRHAYGRFLHHDPNTGHGLYPTRARSGSPAGGPGRTSSVDVGRLDYTVFAWCQAGGLGETCVLWDLDRTVGVEDPWGVPAAEVAASERAWVRATERQRQRLYDY